MSTSDATSPSARATNAVKALLRVSGRTQKALAEHLGCADSQITRRMATGRWSLDDLGEIAQWFDVPMTVFFDRDELAHSLSDLATHHLPCIAARGQGSLFPAAA